MCTNFQGAVGDGPLVRDALKTSVSADISIWYLIRRKMVKRVARGLTLTSTGTAMGKSLIRSHRLWETYLCDEMGYCGADIHRYAHDFEHFTDAGLQTNLSEVTGHPKEDPHQRTIPEV